MGLQEKFGTARVFDTNMSEEGIIGRAVGMAAAGLMPVPEIQFRKYADPAAEQLNDCGSMRWRTANRFAAPMVVRIPGGFFKCGDPWHSQSNEVQWLHGLGWRLAMPSNAQDAVGLLRSALREAAQGDRTAARHDGIAEHRDDEGSTSQGSLAAKAREQLVCDSGGVGVHFSVIVIWRAI